MIASIENDEHKHGSFAYYKLDAVKLPLTQLEFERPTLNICSVGNNSYEDPPTIFDGYHLVINFQLADGSNRLGLEDTCQHNKP